MGIGTHGAPENPEWNTGTYQSQPNTGVYLAVTDQGEVEVLTSTGASLWQKP